MVRSSAAAAAPGRPRCGLLGHATVVVFARLGGYAPLNEANLLL